MYPYIMTMLSLILIMQVVSKDVGSIRQQLFLVSDMGIEEAYLRTCRSEVSKAHYLDMAKQVHRQEDQEHEMETKETHTHHKSKLKSKAKRPYSLQVPVQCPPDNSRLNLYSILKESPSEQARECSWNKIFLRLLYREYVRTGVLQPGEPEMFLEILHAHQDYIVQHAEENKPDVITTLPVTGRDREILYSLLQGKDHTRPILHLLNFSSKATAKKVNFLFMDTALLYALVDRSEVVLELQQLRLEVWTQIKQKEDALSSKDSQSTLIAWKNRSEFRKDLQLGVEKILSQHGYYDLLHRNVLDFTLGKSGSYLFLLNKNTGREERRWYQYKKDTLDSGEGFF